VWEQLKGSVGPQVWELFLCPMATRLSEHIGGKNVMGGKGASGSRFTAWWDSYAKWETTAGSYGINTAIETVGGCPNESWWPAAPNPKSAFWFDPVDGAACASIPVMVDCLAFRTWGEDKWGAPPYEDAYPAVWCGTCINRHDGGVNCVFLDWSVRKVGLKELWTLKWHKQFNTAGIWTKAGGVQPEDWPAWMRRFKDY
jgi:prepilin-type processing-associated H-X9-DG protein